VYMPKFELLSFASLPVQRKQIVLRAALEFLITADWNYLLENPGMPSLYDAAPHYVLKVRPGGLDAWQDIPQTLHLGSGDCFAEGTPLTLESGKEIPIELAKPGMRVRTRHDHVHTITNHGLMALHAPTYEVKSARGHRAIVTAKHRFWTKNRGFRRTLELRPDDQLVELDARGDEQTAQVASIRPAGYRNVYDVTVEDKHEVFAGNILTSQCKDFACLRGDALVRTLAGDTPIRDIVIGDQVLTRAGFKRVAGSALTRKNAETCKLVTESGREIIATPDHRVWTETREWVECGSLRMSDRVLEIDRTGRERFALGVRSVTSAERADVYDIAVEDAHEFFANGVLVHNCWRVAELRNAGYDDVYPHIKVSYHEDPSRREPMMTVYHIQVRIHDIIEDPSAILGMPKSVTYEQLKGDPSAIAQPSYQQAAGAFMQRPPAGPFSPIHHGPFAPQFEYGASMPYQQMLSAY